MKFKVTEKTTSSVSVEFEDGSIATVPLYKGQTKEQIIKDEMIASKCGWTPFNNYKVKGLSLIHI